MLYRVEAAPTGDARLTQATTRLARRRQRTPVPAAFLLVGASRAARRGNAPAVPIRDRCQDDLTTRLGNCSLGVGE
jgi:hypothetical protein